MTPRNQIDPPVTIFWLALIACAWALVAALVAWSGPMAAGAAVAGVAAVGAALWMARGDTDG